MVQKTPGKEANKNIILHNITIKQNKRDTQDIQTWIEAIKNFENPLNPVKTKLYDLYEHILLDGQIEATWGKRQDAISNKALIFGKDGKEDEEIGKLLNSPDIRELIKELHNSILWGYSLIQINNIYYDEIEEQYKVEYDLIPRKHVHPEREFQCVSKEQNFVSRDILYKEKPLANYMIWAGKPKSLGLLGKVAQYVIYKRGDFGDWAAFAEMFGMPFREGRYDDYDENTRHALEVAMEAYGGAAYAILPKNAEFKIHDSTTGNAGSNSLYKDLKDACNAEISKIILGNTLTTEQGTNGARSLGEVHANAEANKNKADELLILGLLNGKFKAILKTFGFNVDGGSIWFKAPDSDWEMLTKKWNVYNGMLTQNIPLDDSFLYEEFDIPMPENYQQLKESLAQTNGLKNVETPIKTNLNSKNSLSKRILDFFV